MQADPLGSGRCQLLPGPCRGSVLERPAELGHSWATCAVRRLVTEARDPGAAAVEPEPPSRTNQPAVTWAMNYNHMDPRPQEPAYRYVFIQLFRGRLLKERSRQVKAPPPGGNL
ncbi:unnamed protein product [Merluccius merluccius]